MSLTISEGATGTYTPPEAGTFAARCVTIIDMGSQISTFDGETKSSKKVLIGFEICDSENRREDGSSHIVSKRFTASLHKKSAMRAFCEAWRQVPFSEAQLKAFNLTALLGQPCLLGIVNVTKPDGKTFPNISSCMRLPKGMPPPAGTEELKHFDMSSPDWAVFAGLSSRLQEQIAASPEFKLLTPPKSVNLPAPQAPAAPAAPARPPAPAPRPAPTHPAFDSGFDDMEDVPF